jgi:hypothetical protein
MFSRIIAHFANIQRKIFFLSSNIFVPKAFWPISTLFRHLPISPSAGETTDVTSGMRILCGTIIAVLLTTEIPHPLPQSADQPFRQRDA